MLKVRNYRRKSIVCGHDYFFLTAITLNLMRGDGVS